MEEDMGVLVRNKENDNGISIEVRGRNVEVREDDEGERMDIGERKEIKLRIGEMERIEMDREIEEEIRKVNKGEFEGNKEGGSIELLKSWIGMVEDEEIGR